MQQAAQTLDFAAPAAPSQRVAAAALYPSPPAGRAGTAEVRAHHGEIVQGMFYSADGTLEHGLVTLPCALFATRARFRPAPTGPLVVEPGDRGRARAAARLTLEALGRTGWGGSLRLEGNVPLRWGCGSSTTDVLATVLAVADALGAALPPEWVSRICVAAESASDSLMHGPERAVLFAQRRGCVLEDLGAPLPRARVLGFNTEAGGVETLALPPCRYSAWELEAFRAVRGLLRRAVTEQDPALLGRVATASTVLMQRHRPKRAMPELLRLARETRAAGVQVAHSGTVAGLLFEPGPPAAERVEQARAGLRRLGIDRDWEFTTDPVPHPEALP